jgi:hypothetical protein
VIAVLMTNYFYAGLYAKRKVWSKIIFIMRYNYIGIK